MNKNNFSKIKNKKIKEFILNLSDDEVNNRIDQLEKIDMDVELRKYFVSSLLALCEVDNILGLKNATIARLRKFFHKESEKRKYDDDKKGDESKNSTGDSPPPSAPKPKSNNRKGSNHGPNGQKDYPNAEVKYHSLENLKAGDPCPEDGCTGKVYKYDDGIYIKVKGQPIAEVVINKTQKLRCNLCQKIFEADFADKDSAKYDSRMVALIVVLKYLMSMPFFRITRFLEQFKIPFPASTQWDLVDGLAQKLEFFWIYWIELSVESKTFCIDDTTGKVLTLIKENKERSAANKAEEVTGKTAKKTKDSPRVEICTSGILCELSCGHKLSLFFTGRKNAGENLDVLLEKRSSSEPAVVMADAHSKNKPEVEANLIWALCLSHGRRKFIDIENDFKDEVKKVIKWIKLIYENEDYCKKEKLSPSERLQYHRKNSLPVVKDLYEWFDEVIKNRLVEPNSSLGESIAYMNKKNRKEEFSRFCEIEGAPLDNNDLERLQRTIVLNIKNWMFYKNERGARVGDIFTSITKSCEIEGVNPMEYLVALDTNIEKVKLNPAAWMPWNYQENFNSE